MFSYSKRASYNAESETPYRKTMALAQRVNRQKRPLFVTRRSCNRLHHSPRALIGRFWRSTGPN